MRNRHFIGFEGMSVCISYDNSPWGLGEEATALQRTVEDRVTLDYGIETLERNRRAVFGMIQMALSGAMPEELLFRSSLPGACFTLRPTPRSSIPLQWVHVGHGTISDSRADTPCADMSVDTLLEALNSVLGTTYELDAPGLRDCLEHVRTHSRDFGEAYGILRPWWHEDFSGILQRMNDLQRGDDQLRQHAIHGASIRNSKLPPRRVWDLFSNRVLPLHAIRKPSQSDPSLIPHNLWRVSHSWVAESERHGVQTPINGGRWPVPLPRATTLDHVRVELLNMGAEYVWLDILCLRQRGGDDETLREQQWELDVPTIGSVYSDGYRPCITYFNGLGLPLDTSPEVTQSDRHWFNRVWTLQESVGHWLPGGLSGSPLIDGPAFFVKLKELVKNRSTSRMQSHVIQALRSRSCTTELDRIAGLAYCLGCDTLPLYKENITQDLAFALLIKHMPYWPRNLMFLQYTGDEPFALWPISWREFLKSGPALPFPEAYIHFSEYLTLTDEAQLRTESHGEYYHQGYALGPCHITHNVAEPGADGNEEFQLQLIDCGPEGAPVSFKATGMHGVLIPGVPYTLVGVGWRWKEHWIVVEVVGEKEVKGEKAVEAVKWGVIRVDKAEGRKLVNLGNGRWGTRVVYLGKDEARKRSGYEAECTAAFAKMKKSRRTVYTGVGGKPTEAGSAAGQ